MNLKIDCAILIPTNPLITYNEVVDTVFLKIGLRFIIIYNTFYILFLYIFFQFFSLYIRIIIFFIYNIMGKNVTYIHVGSKGKKSKDGKEVNEKFFFPPFLFPPPFFFFPPPPIFFF
jgi:hypothetical protein